MLHFEFSLIFSALNWSGFWKSIKMNLIYTRYEVVGNAVEPRWAQQTCSVSKWRRAVALWETVSPSKKKCGFELSKS